MRSALVGLLMALTAGAGFAQDPHIATPDADRIIPFPGHDMQILSRAGDTPAGTAVMELFLPPRTFGAPPHVHTHEDEHFYVIEGEVDFLDRGEVVRAGAGSLAVLPRGHLHGFWNDTDAPARLLLIISPGDFTSMFDEVVAEIRKRNPDRPDLVGKLIAEAAAARGVTVHFEKVPAQAMHLLPGKPPAEH